MPNQQVRWDHQKEIKGARKRVREGQRERERKKSKSKVQFLCDHAFDALATIFWYLFPS